MQKKIGSGIRKPRSTNGRTTVGKRERRRLLQLVVCLGLFLAALFGKGSIPENALQYIQANTEFTAVLSKFGKAVADGEPVVDAFANLFTNAHPAEDVSETDLSPAINERTSSTVVRAALLDLRQTPTRDVILSRMGINGTADAIIPEETVNSETQTPADQAGTTEVYTGPALPAQATMEYKQLGLETTVTPVLGEITSTYGYRDHPVDGVYSFHSGVDIAADLGTPIAAFAAGTVEFIGESEAYGLYIQLDHGNGITTFYCHCSELFTGKGEAVQAGQRIAAVGDSGNATGAHLHLELKQDGIFLNPNYYIETTS